MNEKPKISLLIPTYNASPFLRQCLDSAVNQTFKDIELICLNDGSTDDSLEIMQSYAARDTRIKIIDKENSGYGCSMNIGLDNASGEYIGILESDDFFELDALETLYESAKQNDTDVTKADFYLYWSKPEPHSKKFNWTTPECEEFSKPIDWIECFYRKPSIWSAIYKREFLVQNNIRFTETPGASYQDAAFNFKVWASAKKMSLINKPILYYRQDNEASSVNSPSKVYCVCDEYNAIMQYTESLPNKKDLYPIIAKMRCDTYFWNYERLSEPLQVEFIERMAMDFKQEDENGLTDYSYFDCWRKSDRESIIQDPIYFHATHTKSDKPGKINTLKRLYKYGGFNFILRTLKIKAGN